MGAVEWLSCHKQILALLFAAVASLTVAKVCLAKRPKFVLEAGPWLTQKILSPTSGVPTTSTSVVRNMSLLYRLPNHTTPISYDVFLYPNLETGLYKGTVKALVSVGEETSDIKFHNNGLNISCVAIGGELAKWSSDKKHELVIAAKKDGSKIGVGEVSLVVEYSGDMRNRIVGLYQSTYTDANGRKR